MHRLAGVLLALLLAVSARAQKPLTVSREALSRHALRRAPVTLPPGTKPGTVILLVDVNAAGKVTRVQTLRGPALLEPAAQRSVERWEYRPFERKGKAVAAVGLVRVHLGRRAGPEPKVEQYLARVRSKYATEPELAAKGLRCEVHPEWKEFPLMRTGGEHSRLLRWLRRTRVRLVVPKGMAPLTEIDKPKKPKLNVRELTEANELTAAVRQMVEGFYETWLPFGILGPHAPASAQMKQAAGKTVIEFKRGGTTDWMSFDGTARMIHFTELMPGGEAVEESPHFTPKPGGLLYTGTDFAMHRGKKDTRGAYRIAYRRVEGFRMPKRVEIEVKGGLDVHFRFGGCKIGGR